MGLPSSLVIGTKNHDKLAELVAVLADAAPGISIVEGEWEDVEETGATLAENALLKARAVAAATGHAAIGDDTGLEVEALDGAPGVRTARFAGDDATYADNRRALLAALGGVSDRAARFRTVIAVVDATGEQLALVEGELRGTIATTERGERGFGYDSIFETSDGRTFAELSDGEKNRISHRARALRALIDAFS